jgi:hypothetical protein
VMGAQVEVQGKCGAPGELLQPWGEIHAVAVRHLVLEPCNPQIHNPPLVGEGLHALVHLLHSLRPYGHAQLMSVEVLSDQIPQGMILLRVSQGTTPRLATPIGEKILIASHVTASLPLPSSIGNVARSR